MATPEPGDGPLAQWAGPRKAARFLDQALARCQELEGTAEGRHRDRLAGLRGALQYDLTRAQAGEA